MVDIIWLFILGWFAGIHYLKRNLGYPINRYTCVLWVVVGTITMINGIIIGMYGYDLYNYNTN